MVCFRRYGHIYITYIQRNVALKSQVWGSLTLAQLTAMCACMYTGTSVYMYTAHVHVHLRVSILYSRVCRCLHGYEERTRQYPVGGPAPSSTATPASAELGTTPPNVNTSTADTVPVNTAVNNASGDTTRPAVAKLSMFDFMVAAKAELEEHCAADSPTASGRDEPGGGVGSEDEATPPGAVPVRPVERFCRGGGGASEPVE